MKRDAAPLTLGSDCPICKSADVWFEVGPGDKPGHESIRLHCRLCGAVIKQDVPGDRQGDAVIKEPC